MKSDDITQPSRTVLNCHTNIPNCYGPYALLYKIKHVPYYRVIGEVICSSCQYSWHCKDRGIYGKSWHCQDCGTHMLLLILIMILINMFIVQYPVHFSGPPRNIATHAQHRFAQAVVIQLTQLGFMYSMHYNYPLTIIK